jgi:AcrR family transcriptional regulator
MRAPRQPPLTPRRSQSRNLTGRQTELLDQLENLFLAEGFSYLTLDDIVNELRCSKMTLYTLAPSREQLTLAVLRRFFERALKNVDQQMNLTGSTEDHVGVFLTVTTGEMGRMTASCFEDVMQFATTREVYETFSTACTNRLTQLLAASVGSTKVDTARIAFVAELVRLIHEDMYTGELTARTGLDSKTTLDYLVPLVRASVLPPTSRTTAQIKRVK